LDAKKKQRVNLVESSGNTGECKISTHWKRDATDWREDGPLKRNPKGAKNLDLLGNALLAVILFERFDSLNDSVDYYRDNRSKSLEFMKTEPPLSRIAQLSNRAGPRKRTFSFS
jgi:hypothetical protein